MDCIITSAHTKSVPFPKSGFQKWDVITPKDSENYGKHYVITDYRCWEYENGKIEYYYHIESFWGERFEHNLDKYEKLYSKKREVALELRDKLKYKIEPLLDVKKDIEEDLDIDTTLLTEGIERIKAFLKSLEHVR